MSTDDERRALAESVRGLLAKHAGSAAVRAAMESDLGHDPMLWQLLCEQVGVAALAIPERFGGVGAGFAESHLVLAELAAGLVPTPMLGSVVLGAQAILASGDEDACERLLPEVAAGQRALALCWAGAAGWDTPCVTADGEILDGTAEYVLDGATADTLIVVATTPNGAGLYEIAADHPAVERTATPGMDPTRRYARIRFTDAPATPIGAAPLGRLRDIGWAALAAEQVGAAARCLDFTVEYTKSRIQFGRPIGSFQALKHRMADLYVLVETARSISDAATAALDAGSPDAADDIAAARQWCSEAFSAVAAESIQLHGGIAITWEHDAHLYFKRAHADARLLRPVR